MQAQANAKAAESAAMSEVQKQEAIAQTQLQIEQGKSQFEIQKLEKEAQIKKELMQMKYQFDMKLAEMDMLSRQEKEKEIEDRKDQRTRIQATQQSEMISQRKNDSLPVDFENTPNQLGEGMDLSQFA